MRVSQMNSMALIEDSELVAAIAKITEFLVNKIFISEDLADAKRDGFKGGFHEILSDGRVVWISEDK